MQHMEQRVGFLSDSFEVSSLSLGECTIDGFEFPTISSLQGVCGGELNHEHPGPFSSSSSSCLIKKSQIVCETVL